MSFFTWEKIKNHNSFLFIPFSSFFSKTLNNWLKHDINQLIKDRPHSLKQIHLLINSDHRDEMGSAISTEGIHKTLDALEIPHQFELYEAPKATLSPYILGIAYHIVPAIYYCLQFIWEIYK